MAVDSKTTSDSLRSCLEPLSFRQLQTISSFPTDEFVLHCGPYGCGKTYSLLLGLGMACASALPPRDGGVITLAGVSAQAVKANMCNPLAAMFGSNFRYDSGRRDGFAKDATLFGHRIKIIGISDARSEERIRGLNTYKILGDEITTWGKTDENFNKLQGRLRGETPRGWKLGFVGSTNPDSPTHWLKKLIDQSSDLRYIKWSMSDNITSKAEAYYAKLTQRYLHSSAQYQRYVLGEWTAADGLIYESFVERQKDLIADTSVIQDMIAKNIFKHYIIGCDFGTTNATAIIIAGVDCRGTVVVLKEHYIHDSNLTDVVNIIRNEYYKYHSGLVGIYIDPAANVLSKECIRVGIPRIKDGDNSVLNGIRYVDDLFISGRLIISESCTHLIDELFTYSWDTGSSGYKEKPVKVNDHAVDALRYGLYTGLQGLRF